MQVSARRVYLLQPVIGHIMAFFLNLAKSYWAVMELWHREGALNNDVDIVSCSGITAVPFNEPCNEGLNFPLRSSRTIVSPSCHTMLIAYCKHWWHPCRHGPVGSPVSQADMLVQHRLCKRSAWQHKRVLQA